jgi:hypothetical protein
MAYSITINISVTPGKTYSVSSPGDVELFYDGVKVFGSGATGKFVATNTQVLVAQSNTAITSSLSLTEGLMSYYDMNPGQGGMLVYQPYINKWICAYSFTPESMCMVSNRFVSFKNGALYVHDSSTFNNFYGTTYDSVIAVAHNEAGNTVKTYDTISVEGDRPDRVHIRTESPNVQSSDLDSSDFRSLEGVWSAPILRDRLSPNTGTSNADQNLYIGDKIRGDIAKFMVFYTQPTSLKQLKFVNINFDPSRGQTV